MVCLKGVYRHFNNVTLDHSVQFILGQEVVFEEIYDMQKENRKSLAIKIGVHLACSETGTRNRSVERPCDQ